MYRSDDGGSLWEPLMSDGLVNAIEALAVDGEGTVFAGTDGGQVLSALGQRLVGGRSRGACADQLGYSALGSAAAVDGYSCRLMPLGSVK